MNHLFIGKTGPRAESADRLIKQVTNKIITVSDGVVEWLAGYF